MLHSLPLVIYYSERLFSHYHCADNNEHMKNTTTDSEFLFSYESMLIRFKRAKSESTLNTMYQGATRKAIDNLQDKELLLAQIAIERALDRCQQDFDVSLLGMTRKTNHTLKQAEAPCKPRNPEDEIGRLLRDMDKVTAGASVRYR